MTRLVLFIFAGRRANMEVQMPYLHRLLDTYPEAELHLWDLTRNSADQSYVRGLDGSHGDRVRVLTHLHPGFPVPCLYPNGAIRRRRFPACTCILHKPPYEQPYRYYAADPAYDGAVFVKMDDDVLFLETDRFNDLILPLSIHPNRVISANVANNAVCAKYEPELVEITTSGLYDPRDPKFDRFWWAAHTSADFALTSHAWFINEWATQPRQAQVPTYVRTRPGEAVSINCIAFTHTTMKRMAKAFEFNPRLGDEGVVDSFLPWIARGFHAAHLTFGPQDKALTPAQLDGLRKHYAALAEVYLDDSWKGELV